MKSKVTIVGLALAVLAVSNASAQTNDHFARQRREAVARQEAARQHFSNSRSSAAHGGALHRGSGNYNLGHWGGPTTTTRYYHPSHRHAGHGNIHYYPVHPFGFGIPAYGYYGGVYPYYRTPHYGYHGGSGIYIHREIYHSR